MRTHRGETGTSLELLREYTALPASHPELITPVVFTPSELSALSVVLIKCGTAQGYRQHQREGDLPCGDCHRAWENDPGSPRDRDCCGTNTGWRIHRANRETPCAPCLAARQQHVDDSHGTYAGWMLHRRAGTMCDQCIAARNHYQNSRLRGNGARTWTE